MKATFYVPGWELGRIQCLIKKHGLRWAMDPWERFMDVECCVTGDVHDYNRFEAELEAIRKHDQPPAKSRRKWWESLLRRKR